ncbi:MAG: isocitrate/isopropylmalate dehydrogenase family protein [Planctomyces sp.]|nr:isocitrate/isopropylmalate dehydrogenase family protein [Planctomyces sp.]
MQARFRTAVLPGDGIGVEVMSAALRVLRRLEQDIAGLAFIFEEHSAGANEFLRSGDPLPESVFEACRSVDAVLLGAMGLPDVRWPDGRELTPQIDLRERLDLYCGLRPIRLYSPAHSPLKQPAAGEIDLVIVRESTEGLFSGRLLTSNPDSGTVEDRLRITRRGSERLFRRAFELARTRRRKVTLVDKANVLPSMVFFRTVFDDVARDYPDVATERTYVDAAALFLVQRPQTFDVIVTENMFGDILSDLAAGLVGGMGMAPSADLGDECGVFQPAHGTAPDIAGQGIANPVGMILSAALMLDWLGTPPAVEGGRRIRRGVEAALADPTTATRDLGGTLSTSEMTERILTAVGLAG